MADTQYEIRLAPAAARALKKLPAHEQLRLRKRLHSQASNSGRGPRGGRGGKTTKAIRGRADRFFRLRVGDYRVMYDVIDGERTLLVLGIVHRRDLERWLRTR